MGAVVLGLAVVGVDTAVAAASPTYAPTELAQTFTLQSDPASHKVIYLDFVGFDDVVYDWSTQTNVPVTYTAFDVDGNLPCPVGTADPACFTTAELTMIRDTWARVAAAYAPFDVNVTTQDPGRAAIINSCWVPGNIFATCAAPNDPDYGAHLSFTDAQPAYDICQAGTLYSGCGFPGWFDGHVRSNRILNEVAGFVLPGNLARVAPLSGYSLGLTAVHELGHVLGLGHAMDGGSCISGTCYSNGTYGGPDHLMEGVMWPLNRVGANGAPLHQLTPWGEGLTAGDSVPEDAYARMELPRQLSSGTYPMGIVARTDEPSPVVEPNADWVASGVITPSRSSLIYTANVSMPSANPSLVRPTDQDSFRFTVPAGAQGISINVTPAAHSSLDVGATLYDASMTPIATSDPAAVRVDNDTATGLDASISAALAPGDYTLVVDGVGSPGVDNSLAGATWSARYQGFPSYTCPSCGAADYGSIGAYTVEVATEYPTGVSIGGGSVAEGDTGKPRTVTFPVVLPAPSTTTVSVGYSIEVDGTAHAATACTTSSVCAAGGGDFVAKSGTVTFTPSATTGVTPTVKYVSALVYPDTASEGDETFRVVLSNPVGVGLGRPVGIGTIVDDDPAGAAPTVAVGDASVPEGDSAFKVTQTNSGKVWVTLSQPVTSATPVTVQVTVVPVDASAGTDFKFGSTKTVFPVTKTVTFTTGQWQKAVTIGVFPDTTAEGDETVTVTLSNPTGGPVLGRSVGTFSILDDD